MCGIAGYFGTSEIPRERLEQCLTLMGRRGPESAAYEQWTGPAGRNTFLLHSRLRIIDLDPRANQPFTVGDKHTVFNGELYNYREVKRDLEARGRSFRTESDTEVMLTALDEHGDSILDQCEGMWAYAVYDERDGSLNLGRDRFGEKPLYLYRDPTGLYFGSEVKFIVALLGRRLPVNYEHLSRYLVNGYKSIYKQGHTFFAGLSELPAASTLRIDANGREQGQRYWEPRFRPDDSISYEDAVAGVRERLIRAVELRLRADVPLAFCMSGGVDSNALIGIAKRHFDYDVHGFTIVNSDPRYNEDAIVNPAVAELGIRHTAIPVETKDFLPRLRTLVRQHDAPVYTITYYAHWLLMESIKAADYKISISGTAADELFSGYYDHHLAYLREIRSDFPSVVRSAAAWGRYIRPIVRNPHLGDPMLFIENPDFRDHIFLNAEAFSEALQEPFLEPFAETVYTDDLLRNRMLNEMFHEAVPVILHEDDLNAMYYSIENRSPFLDRELFDYAYQIPTRHLIRNGAAKAVLRDAVRGFVPDAVLDNRTKVGFNAPIESFLDMQDPAVKALVLEDSPIFEHLRRDKIEEMFSGRDLKNSVSKFLFYFLSAKMFLEECA